MFALRDVQDLFREGLLGELSPALIDLVEDDGLDPRARLAVYRHHVLTTLTATLEAAFPVVCRLVDSRFFAYAADAFIRQILPAGPCLDEYGAAFPDFLATFEACRQLTYLPDVARLEWAIHRASQAPAGEPLDAAQLARVAPADMTRLRFVPNAGLAYLASPWPVDAIWRAHRDESQALPDLDAGSVRLEISPSAEGVRIRSLHRESFAFRDALARGNTLAEAVESVPYLDLTGAIRSILDDNIFDTFTMPTEEDA